MKPIRIDPEKPAGPSSSDEIVEAALGSTGRYLEFLEASERGIERHRATLAGTEAGEPTVVEGKPVLLYRFEVERRLRLTPDTAVRFVPAEGGEPQDVFIHAYDHRTGQVELGFRSGRIAAAGTLEISFRWLVERIESWLEDRGDKIVPPSRLTLPARAPTSEDVDAVLGDRALFPISPSASQVEAVLNAVRKPFSYTWGPPGSGKTDFALAGAACALLRRGLRIAILAPTNLAMENALRAVLRRLRGAGWDSSKVLRLGLPTPDFVRDFPDHCEDHSIRSELGTLRAELWNLRMKRDLREERAELARELEALDKKSSKRAKSKTLGVSGKRAEIREAVVARLAELGGPPEESGLDDTITAIEGRLAALASQEEGRESRLADQKVLGLTLDGFVGMSGRGLKVDWILLDEAAYAPIAKTLPLLSLNAPIAMFGDHRQLPPVCEADEDEHEITAYWGQSAIHVESAFRDPTAYEAIAKAENPKFEHLSLASIKDSYRFGDEFAQVLDQFVYQIGLRGKAAAGTEVATMEVAPDRGEPEKKRTSESEAQGVVEALADVLQRYPDESAVVLTPYKNQAALIRSMLKSRRGPVQAVEVLNTHRAQGREWDTVIFSAVDGSRPACRPYFTDSRRPIGRVVINTTLSRVKRRLILVLERGYWRVKPDQLLGRLAALGLSMRYA